MKRLAFLSLAIGTLLAPITVQAQQGCVTFPAPHNHEAELRYLLSHPGTRVCPAAPAARTYDPGQSARFGGWLTDSTIRTIDLMRTMNNAH
jgi:hypothetical protein